MPEITNEHILNKLESWDRWRVQIEAEQQKQRKTLYGNGEPGWDEMIREMWRDLQERKEAAKDKDKDRRAEIKRYVFFGITIVISNLLALLVTHLTP